MSEIKVNKISPRAACGTVQLGDSGDTITIPSGATITNSGTAAGFGSTGEISWDTTKKTGDFTGASGVGYFIDTGSGAVTLTLPSSPSAGNVVGAADYNGTASSNNITIARNGSNINGSAANFIISKNFSAVQLIYVDATVGWQSVFTGSTGDVQNPFLTASGGTESTCGDFKIHTFTGPGTFTVSSVGATSANNSVDYLVQAGGAGGGADIGGGGGGGGTRFRSGTFSVPSPLSPISAPAGVTVTATAFPITVGGGGAGGGPGNPVGTSGSTSSFSTISSAGGGGGGKLKTAGAAGGNGGGGGGVNDASGPYAGGTGNTPSVSPDQGKAGGIGLGGSPYSPGPLHDGAGAGGGGVQSVGTNGGPTYGPSPAVAPGGGGAGGAGMPFPASSFQSSATGYGGGGGGGGYTCGSSCNSRPAGTATDGGGAGGQTASQNGTAGTTNRGGGGGGGAGANGNGGAGGSGIVIIRYQFQ